MRELLLVFTLCLIIRYSAESLPSNNSVKGKDKVKFYVYTRLNPDDPEALDADVESVVRNIINPSKPTTLAIHGMGGNKNADEYRYIKDTKLLYEDGNVIVVDYSDLKVSGDFIAAYEATPVIAEACTDLIYVLHHNFDMDLQDLHVVGFSLGAQVAGLVGKQFALQYNERLKRITALDPAGGHLFESLPANERLSRNDAEFVEVIHTNAGVLGFSKPCGHVDYYVNGGKVQPGCSSFNAGCSHGRAYQLITDMWLPSENHELLILKCSGIEYLGLDKCRWLNKKMGDLQEQQIDEGVYYVATNDNEPFGKGAFKTQFL